MRPRLRATEDIEVAGEPEPQRAEGAAVDETVAPGARRRARAAAQDAKALTAQAEHQVRRARRNVAEARKGLRARVLAVDDSPAFVHAAASLVSAAPSLRLVGAAASGDDAMELLTELKPDLVLLDVHMPGLDGVETARLIRDERPEAVVVLVSADPAGFETAGRAAGAVAVLDKRRLSSSMLEELWSKHRPEP